MRSIIGAGTPRAAADLSLLWLVVIAAADRQAKRNAALLLFVSEDHSATGC
jgi:hypothetical protein